MLFLTLYPILFSLRHSTVQCNLLVSRHISCCRLALCSVLSNSVNYYYLDCSERLGHLHFYDARALFLDSKKAMIKTGKSQSPSASSKDAPAYSPDIEALGSASERTARLANPRRKTWRFRMRPADDDEPQSWWFCSTAIPLLAATTGPLANVMSIAGTLSGTNYI